MIVFFLPNGIGDLLMSLPVLRRLIVLRGIDNVRVVVSNATQSLLLKKLIDPRVRTIERYGALYFSQFKLWVRLFFMRADWIFAPLLSTKKINKIFFATLLTNTLVPSSLMRERLFLLRPSKECLSKFKGHQTNFYVEFLAEILSDIDKKIVVASELLPPGMVANNARMLKPIVAKVVVGVSCGVLERHKIPQVEMFVSLLRALSEQKNIELLLIGSLSDEHLLNTLIRNLPPSLQVEKLIDSPIDVVIKRMADCHLGISGTTGQGHMMAAAGLPILVLAGVTNPHESGPYVDRAAVLRHRYACGPCYQENYRFGCGQVDCMNTLDVAEGVSLACQLIDSNEFGFGWMLSSPKFSNVSLDARMAIHSRPIEKWISP